MKNSGILILVLGLAAMQWQWQMHLDREASDERFMERGAVFFSEIDPNYVCKRSMEIFTKGHFVKPNSYCKSHEQIMEERDE